MSCFLRSVTVVAVVLGMILGTASLSNESPPVTLAAYNVPPFPAGDCVSMAASVLTAIAISRGQAAVATGRGAFAANASAGLSLMSQVVSTGNCSTYMAKVITNEICSQSRRVWWKDPDRIMAARSFVGLATRGKHWSC
jgi:hypothetical protein